MQRPVTSFHQILGVFVTTAVFYAKLNICEASDFRMANSSALESVVHELMEGGYDRGVAPGKPTVVKLGLYLNSLDTLSEVSMDYTVTIYLRLGWQDHRLKFKPFKGENLSRIKTEDGTWNIIWTPDVFLRNEKKANFHEVTRPNRLMWIYSDGYVYYSTKVSLTLACTMNLRKYPMDNQVCPMKFESFGYTTKDLRYEWRHCPVELEPILLPHFVLTSWDLFDCTQNYSTGQFPCLNVEFHLARSLGFFLTQMYLPTTLVVVLSWVGFWISHEAVPARVTIGLLTVLTMSSQNTGARSSLPQVSYVKALDIWMAVCLLFVFSIFGNCNFTKCLEHTGGAPPDDLSLEIFETDLSTATIMNGPNTRKVTIDIEADENATVWRKRASNYGDACSSAPLETVMGSEVIRVSPEYGLVHRPAPLDKASRILFPLIFVAFNVCYWYVYLIYYQTEEEARITHKHNSDEC